MSNPRVAAAVAAARTVAADLHAIATATPARLVAAASVLDSPVSLFAAGWLMVFGGLALVSWPVALVTGGALLLAIVFAGALRKA